MSKITLHVEQVNVLERDCGTDIVNLKIADVGNPIPCVGDSLWITFHCQKGTAKQYLQENFDLGVDNLLKG